MFKQLKDLEGYNPKNLDRINSKKETLINAEKLYNNRKNVIKGFENGVFPLKDKSQKKKKGTNQLNLTDYIEVSYGKF